GSRKIVEDFGKQIAEFTSFDGGGSFAVNKAVGSKRYKVTVRTEGGHSYSRFGNRNAIAYMSSLISALYDMKVPEKGKTTYNVGTISGGTSVNTIAQHCEMLYEVRSDELDSLKLMEQHFMAAVEFYRTKGIDVEVELVGDRPCAANVDPVQQKALQDRVAGYIQEYYGQEIKFTSGSTDCNIPFSVGIPSICYGCYEGKGGHTREEAVKIDSLYPGLKVAFASILYHF
ncbi:MAG: peptidase dimerization domain-containing protein, partial [Firmicutes bacterium]|nr:peptidase dimerization domain-containing protein [Bacillota bacterium]